MGCLTAGLSRIGDGLTGSVSRPDALSGGVSLAEGLAGAIGRTSGPLTGSLARTGGLACSLSMICTVRLEPLKVLSTEDYRIILLADGTGLRLNID